MNAETLNKCKDVVDNLLVDPRKITRDIEVIKKDEPESVVDEVIAFIEDYSNGRVQVIPTMSLLEYTNQDTFGLKLKIKF